MTFDMSREEMIINNVLGKESSQIIVEGDIIVPDVKADIDFILLVSGEPEISEEKIGDNRINFKGELFLSIIYQAKRTDKLIHSMNSALPFEDFIYMESLDKDANANVKIEMSHIEYKLINDRKINIKAIITIKADAKLQEKKEIIKEINEEDIETLNGKIMITDIVDNAKDRFMIKEDVILPSNKPNISDIISYDMQIGDKEIKVLDGRILVKGVLNVTVIYTGVDDNSIIETVETEIPFNGYIESKNANENMFAISDLKIEDKNIRVLPDDDGEDRNLEVEAAILADIKVMNPEEISVIEDAYSLDKPLDITKESITYPHHIGRNSAKSSIKETITIDGTYPDMLQIEHIWGNVELGDIEVTDDKVVAEGVVHLEVMYLAENDNSPVSVVPVDIPFVQEIEVKGAKSYMEVDVVAQIDNISFSMLSNREVEIRVTLGFEVYVFENINGEIISNIEFSDDTEKVVPIASVAIYVVQNGDSLWKIAKKYNTTIEDILLLNDIENPDKIYPGQKLLVLKKVITK